MKLNFMKMNNIQIHIITAAQNLRKNRSKILNNV